MDTLRPNLEPIREYLTTGAPPDVDCQPGWDRKSGQRWPNRKNLQRPYSLRTFILL